MRARLSRGLLLFCFGTRKLLVSRDFHDHLPGSHLVKGPLPVAASFGRDLRFTVFLLAIVRCYVFNWICLQIDEFVEELLPELELILVHLLQTWPQDGLAVRLHLLAVVFILLAWISRLTFIHVPSYFDFPLNRNKYNI